LLNGDGVTLGSVPFLFQMKYLCLLFFALCASASAENSTITENAVLAANSLALYNDPQWRALLHYERSFPLWENRSRSESEGFILAPNGKTDPKAELEATIRAFYAESASDDDHATCLFRARREWIGRFVPDLPERRCERFRTWFEAINPEGATLIFPASFLNNPASAFGHTFIRIDQPGQNESTRLLAYTADYSAATSGEDALTYAMKGMFGGYYGFYSVSPYYEKVTTYSDLENRDIWEYELNLTKEEVTLMVLHLWELRQKGFSYFYFDENCSFHILGLLNVARPHLRLTQAFRNWAIPSDTIREMVSREGLLKQSVYRPSAATKLRYKVEMNEPKVQDVAIDLARDASDEDELNKLDLTKQARAIDLAYEFQTYTRIKEQDEAKERKDDAWKLLSKRSKISVSDTLFPPTPAVRPDQGHKTVMASVGAGWMKDRVVADYTFRPAFHALSDYQPGYVLGSQIKFLELNLRQAEGKGVDVENFTLLNITSLSPRDKFFKSLSWHVEVEGRRVRKSESEDFFVGDLSTGFGYSYELSPGILTYAMLDGEVNLSHSYRDNYSLGAGPRVGVLANWSDTHASELIAVSKFYPLGERTERTELKFSQRYAVSKDRAVRLDVGLNRELDYSNWESVLRFELFFSP